MENDSVSSFTFIEKEAFHGDPEFLSVCNAFGVEVVKVLLFACFRAFAQLFFCLRPLLFHTSFSVVHTHFELPYFA